MSSSRQALSIEESVDSVRLISNVEETYERDLCPSIHSHIYCEGAGGPSSLGNIDSEVVAD